MELSLEKLLGKRETAETSPKGKGFKNTGLALAGAGLLALLSPQLSDADTTVIHRDRHGRETGYEQHINIGPIPINPNPLGDPQAKFYGRSEDELMRMGIQAYNNGAIQHAYDTFTYIAGDLNPGNIEAHVYHVKSWYKKISKEEGEPKARADSAYKAKAIYERFMHNDAMLALAKRFEKNEHPLDFSLDAYWRFEAGMKAYKREDYQTASKLLRQSVNEDPWNEDGWFYLASSEQRKTGDKTKKHAVWKEAVKYHNSFQEDINKFCK